MNCETCQELIHDLVDGSISRSDESTLNTHLKDCLDCESVRQDLSAIVGFCQTRRGEYEAPPNERALWLRIRNVIEADQRGNHVVPLADPKPSFWGRLMGRSWELSLPQLVASTVAIVVLVSLVTVVGLRRLGTNGPSLQATTEVEASTVNERIWQRQQVINYWSQQVQMNQGRWNPEMREKFERSLRVIDETVANSIEELKKNPHDEFSEQALNQSLNDKLDLLQAFAKL
jgi:hypothetical protein